MSECISVLYELYHCTVFVYLDLKVIFHRSKGDFQSSIMVLSLSITASVILNVWSDRKDSNLEQ